MGNEIDEVTGSTDQNGRDINVINKQIRVEVGNESTIFEIALWLVGTIPGIIILTTDAMPVLQGVGVLAAGFLPGVIFQFMKISALAYLRRLQQKVQADASQIDNYLEQRVIILQNVVGLVEKSIELDKDVMKSVAAYRAGRLPTTDTGRNAASQELDGIFSRVNVAFEAYPELKAQATLADAMRQNSYLQKEITAARTLYNDTVAMWNQEIFRWPTNQIVAARAGYTTRIPFIASAETKAEARGTFF
ncbi:MAG: LemA family protein [Proteobacteria bacterium]|jgi:LemA protein|nr:LemA family protein [Pseudomonadota bacterium]NDE06693.1 LemA family protein [Chloroflexota bacterium]NBQ32785.1 LemA family protein [Pseudomonadota bacterium]NBQ62648.1 LemA family protein [Pseudomonadota bacterium]NBT20037.1 LemA family protein [Pseudomonadota bacterium]